MQYSKRDSKLISLRCQNSQKKHPTSFMESISESHSSQNSKHSLPATFALVCSLLKTVQFKAGGASLDQLIRKRLRQRHLDHSEPSSEPMVPRTQSMVAMP